MLIKLCASKGDYCNEQYFSSIVSLFKIGSSLKSGSKFFPFRAVLECVKVSLHTIAQAHLLNRRYQSTTLFYCDSFTCISKCLFIARFYPNTITMYSISYLPICLKAKGTPYTCWCISGLKNSTGPLVFTSASGCKASENFKISRICQKVL